MLVCFGAKAELRAGRHMCACARARACMEKVLLCCDTRAGHACCETDSATLSSDLELLGGAVSNPSDGVRCRNGDHLLRSFAHTHTQKKMAKIGISFSMQLDFGDY